MFVGYGTEDRFAVDGMRRIAERFLLPLAARCLATTTGQPGCNCGNISSTTFPTIALPDKR
ncbi:MAG: hypothetical protein IPL58_12915 [Betaproteobacteria bacterium]|uniref:Uncharacterized protein n=1 Tax=Candidatus Proximibacter danicus TaxID=2954365 RepID=A0A9D7K1N7_9PROT|nr:hypothetical protein [Candidatus Proximibacter danicus]